MNTPRETLTKMQPLGLTPLGKDLRGLGSQQTYLEFVYGTIHLWDPCQQIHPKVVERKRVSFASSIRHSGHHTAKDYCRNLRWIFSFHWLCKLRFGHMCRNQLVEQRPGNTIDNLHKRLTSVLEDRNFFTTAKKRILR